MRLLPHPTPAFALNPPPLDQSLLERYGLANDYLFYPAQFWAHKNHFTILRALVRLRDEHGIRQPIVFTGSDQGNEAYVRNMTRELGLEDQVKFLGFLPFEDVVQLYRQALGLCYMSFFGPENLPPLEAFGLECPVIASQVSGAEEQLGDAVISVDPRDDRQLADAIIRLRTDQALRAELIKRGKVRAASFTTEHFVHGMIDICDEFEVFRRCWKAA
jgi:glycosyltransferase involved in cell wall biosynthesis